MQIVVYFIILSIHVLIYICPFDYVLCVRVCVFVYVYLVVRMFTVSPELENSFRLFGVECDKAGLEEGQIKQKCNHCIDRVSRLMYRRFVCHG